MQKRHYQHKLKIEEPTKRLFNSNPRQINTDGETYRRSQNDNHEERNIQQIILTETLTKHDLLDYYQNFKNFEIQITQYAKKGQINKLQDFCRSFKQKIQLESHIQKNRDSSISLTSNYSNMVQVLEELYECREKLKKYEGHRLNLTQSCDQDDNFDQQKTFSKVILKEVYEQSQKKINKISDQNAIFQQNLPLQSNSKEYNNLKNENCHKNEQINNKLKNESNQTNNSNIFTLVHIYKLYLQVKAGYITLCGYLWKIFSLLGCSESNQLLLLVNNVRRKQITSPKFNPVTNQTLKEIMQQSNSQLLAIPLFVKFMIHQLTTKQVEQDN